MSEARSGGSVGIDGRNELSLFFAVGKCLSYVCFFMSCRVCNIRIFDVESGTLVRIEFVIEML